MEYRRLGDSGLLVSKVGLGGNNFGRAVDLDGTRAVVDAALDAGVTLIDTADVYGGRQSERLLGEALRGRRAQVVLATKFGMDMGGENGPDWGARGSRRYVRLAVESSLGRLQTDWIDLYQYHAPDSVTPLEETLDALDDLVREGKVRYIGSSNLAAWQVVDADSIALRRGRTRFVSAQNPYSLLDRRAERELVPACVARGVGILPYFPLANGLLTGKYRRGEALPPGSRLAAREVEIGGSTFDALEHLGAYASARGHSLLEVAIGALAAQPGVASVIAGATSAEQVRANAATGGWVPSKDDLVALDEVVPRGRRA